MEDERKSELRERTDRLKADRLKGPRQVLAASKEGAEPSGELRQPSGPPRANEEWRHFYGAVRDAVERLRQ